MKFWQRAALLLTALVASTTTIAQDTPVVAPLTPAAVESPAAATQPVPGAREGRALTKADIDAWLDGYVPYALRSGDVAGMTIAVVKDGQLLTSRGYGYADVAKRTPVDPARTLFRPGSVSKLVTWTAVMQLVEAGKLDLDRDVNAYLDFKIKPYDGKPVTLRHILTHTGGFAETVKFLIFSGAKNQKALGDYLKGSQPKRIFAPGTTPAYSNWATALAGYIVERQSGLSFDDYVEQRIFQPLGMRDSTFRQPLPARLAPQMAIGYGRASGDPVEFEIVGPAPAGSLSSPATDMARFMLAHLQGGELDGKRILSAATARQMHTTSLSIIPPLNRMELGFFETNINGRQVIAHLGDTQAFHTSLHLFMDEGVGLYFSFNSGGKEGAAGTIRAALFQDFADRYFPDTTTDGRVDAKTAAAHAKLMVGTWENSRRTDGSFLDIAGFIGQTKIAVGPKGELIIPDLKDASGTPRKWVEIAPFVWRDAFGHERLAAKVVDGEVVRWSFDMVSPFMVFERAPVGRSSAWLLPLLYLALGVLALTFLHWPTTWYIRRGYKAELGVAGNARRAYRLTRGLAGASLLLLAGWLTFVTMLFADLNNTTDALDPWLILLQILSLVVFVGAVAVSGWNAWLAWRDGRRWPSKLWNTLVFVAALVVLYVALTFHLISFGTQY